MNKEQYKDLREWMIVMFIMQIVQTVILLFVFGVVFIGVLIG